MKNPGIYILTSPSGKQYVGKDANLPSRTKEHLSGKSPQCPAIHDAIQRYGRDAFSVEIIRYPGISEESLSAVERWWIKQLQTLAPSGYNLTDGGEGLFNPSAEIRQKMSASARRDQKKRVEEGTHHFLDGEIQRRNAKKRVEEGTHPFLGGEVSRRNAKKRVEEGTHPFLGGEIQKKRVEEGTHPFLGGEIQKKQVEEGTHPFLGGEIQRRNAKKQLADGTHNFLGKNNPVHKRVADGTHNFLSKNNPARSEIARRNTKKRIKDGTHNFLGESNPNHARTLKRLKGEWCYIVALSRFWYEIHDYTLKRRKEFLSKDIPDLSNAEQTYLFFRDR